MLFFSTGPLRDEKENEALTFWNLPLYTMHDLVPPAREKLPGRVPTASLRPSLEPSVFADQAVGSQINRLGFRGA